MPTHYRPSRALPSIIVGSLLLAFGVAAPAAADDYPSWDDVLKARQSESATAAQISEIEGLLVKLDNEAARLGREA
ncbi:MAG: hypothetical protein EPN91_05380, partial [Salinibacterium sp.]